MAENISISLLPIVSAKKSLDLLRLLLFALPPTYECILSSSEEIISPKINIETFYHYWCQFIYRNWGVRSEECTNWGLWWDGGGGGGGGGLPATIPGYKSEPPLHWDSSSCDLVYLWDLRCLLDILDIFNISPNTARGRAIISQYNSGMGGDS